MELNPRNAAAKFGTSLGARPNVAPERRGQRAFAANFSDLSGPTNPTGILSPAFLRLKLAVDSGDKPENVLQALYDWLSQRKFTSTQVDQILALPSAEHAYEALLELVGGGLKAQGMPQVAKQTLQRTIQLIARHSAEGARYQGALAAGHVKSMQSKFGMESATRIVNSLIND